MRIALLFLVALAACAPRPALVTFPAASAVGQVHEVYVATTRAAEAPFFGPIRSTRESYLRMGISVPPDRGLGEIDGPGAELDPRTDFLVTSRAQFEGERQFRNALSASLRALPRRLREAVIYVHGFNSRFEDGVLRLAQMAQDFDLPGVAVHYSWPSAGNPFGYAYDSDSALIGRDGLEKLIETVRDAGARRVVIVAHSMGGLVTMEALRQMAIAQPGSVARTVSGVILISPDLDVDLFRAQANRIGTLPGTFAIFVSERDRALMLSARLTGMRERLGNLRDPAPVADLAVTLVDVSAFSRGAGHFTPGTSPALISLLGRARQVGEAFGGDASGRTGLLPGTVLTVQNATEVILSPVAALAR